MQVGFEVVEEHCSSEERCIIVDLFVAMSCSSVTAITNDYNLFKEPADLTVLLLYFVCVLGIGLWVSSTLNIMDRHY